MVCAVSTMQTIPFQQPVLHEISSSQSSVIVIEWWACQHHFFEGLMIKKNLKSVMHTSRGHRTLVCNYARINALTHAHAHTVCVRYLASKTERPSPYTVDMFAC